jgi:hypothetical protein
MAGTKVVTFRLPEEQAAVLETVARFDGVALAEELRDAVDLLLAARRNDPDFVARVQDSLEQVRGILDGVEGGEAVLKALTPKTPLDGGDATGSDADQRAGTHERVGAGA